MNKITPSSKSKVRRSSRLSKRKADDEIPRIVKVQKSKRSSSSRRRQSTTTTTNYDNSNISNISTSSDDSEFYSKEEMQRMVDQHEADIEELEGRIVQLERNIKIIMMVTMMS